MLKYGVKCKVTLQENAEGIRNVSLLACKKNENIHQMVNGSNLGSIMRTIVFNMEKLVMQFNSWLKDPHWSITRH